MNINRVRLVVVGLAVALITVGCSSPNPVSGSKRLSSTELIRDVQSAEICAGGVTLQSPSPQLVRLGTDPNLRFGRCTDGFDINYYPPAVDNSITTIFSPIVCANIDKGNRSPSVVWGSNWVVTALDVAGNDSLKKVAEVTNGSLTDVATMHAVFCEALEK